MIPMPTDMALAKQGICPMCKSKDLHDGPRAEPPHGPKRLQQINLACFTCNARFDSVLYHGQLINFYCCGRITDEEKEVFRSERVFDLHETAGLDSPVRTTIVSSEMRKSQNGEND